MDHAKIVRDAAAALQKAISDARAAGYRVDGVGSLDIAVSETAKVKKPAAPAPEAPKTFGSPKT